MALALLFPGQGTLHAATLPWLDERPEAAPTLQQLAATLDPQWRARLADAAWSSTNRHAQPLITGLAIAAWSCLADKVPAPAVVAGYSVGEVAAFHAAGVYDAATALTLATDRAEAMARAAAGQAMGLLAVHDVPAPLLRSLCERHALATAIRLGGDSTIVGGLAPALDAAAAELARAGHRSTRLAIDVASHTPWMAPAAAEFAQRLASVSFAPPRAAIVCNFGASVTRSPAELSRRLAAQIATPIDWRACSDAIAERRVRCVLEVGPGTTLAALWRVRHPEIPVRSLDDFRSPEAVAAWVQRTLAVR